MNTTAITKSWKTTVAGILQFIAIASVQFGYLLDTDATTNPDYSLLIAAFVTLIGLIFSRDNDVSSEKAKAQTGEEATR